MPNEEPPRDPDDPDAPIRLMDARFWAALGFVLLCVVAGLFVDFAGPRLWPKVPPKPVAATPHSR